MAVTLINLTGAAWGIASDETGVNIREFKCTVEPEFIEHLPGKTNEVRGSAIAAMKLTVDISGEYMGATGVLAATSIVAFVPTNSTAYWGAPTTGLLLTRGELTLARDGWKDVVTSFESFAGRTTA
jgi:hypothetical protein